MGGFWSLLIFAALFYFMMRFGCGAHMVHGHPDEDDNQTNRPDESAKDPVCGMKVAVDRGYGKMHEGKLYRFCSRDCLDKFDSDPNHYIQENQLNQAGAS